MARKTILQVKRNKKSDTALMKSAISFLAAVSENVRLLLSFRAKTGRSKKKRRGGKYPLNPLDVLTVALALMFLFVPIANASSCGRKIAENPSHERYLKGFVNQTFNDLTLYLCQVKCFTVHPRCKSVNYITNKNGLGTCEHNYEKKSCAHPDDFTVRTNSFYVDVKSSKSDQELCSTCNYRGVLSTTKSGQPGFVCSCQKGFNGDQCQNDINECSDNPCHSNATCNNTVGSFVCSCEVGYYSSDGFSCSDVNECSDEACHANATCSNTVESFVCSCDIGFTGDGFNCSAVNLSSSLILARNQSYELQLRKWLPGGSRWILCWRASEHGWLVSTFHYRCDNKRPTVTIIRVGNYVFGGYTDQSWNGSGVFKSSTKSFIFSLRNKDNLSPFKAAVYQYSEYAIDCRPDTGPTFGGGWDLHISENASSNNKSHTKFGLTYQPPSGYSYNSSSTRALLAGSCYFSPSEVEVFYLR